ncbi:MAG: bifunctional folylpolyglutamate synthase/dihydrofolate synthase [Candidatus Kapaibacterium sp.]
MTTEHLLERLFAMHRFGIKPGLERTLRLLAHVDDPHRRMRYIHVAGTNGKGSVCATMASILQEQGLRVGLYTSPHIHRFHERIRFNGECITDEEIVQLFGRIEPFIAETEATFFEVTTVMAFLAFAEREVDVCVLETGRRAL